MSKAIKVIMSTQQEIYFFENEVIDTLDLIFSQFINPDLENVLVSMTSGSKVLVMKNQILTVLYAEVVNDGEEQILLDTTKEL